MSDTVVRNVRPWGGPAVDLVVIGGVITALVPVGTPASGAVVDGGGRIALPSFVDAHAHLDSTRLGLPFRPHTAAPGLLGLIENDRRNWRSAGASVTDRASTTLGATIASGRDQGAQPCSGRHRVTARPPARRRRRTCGARHPGRRRDRRVPAERHRARQRHA